MVAYKKLSNGERVEVCKKMCQTYYENSELKKKIDEAELEWQTEVKKNIPQEVLDLEKKYPNSFVHKSYNVDLYNLSIAMNAGAINLSYFDWPKLNCENIVFGFMGKLDKNKWYTDYDDLTEWLLDRNSVLYDKIKNEIIPGLKEMDKFIDDLECALNSISTVNILKNEMPEAYNVYVELYGEPQTYCSAKKKDGKNCDRIEKVRAMFNSNQIDK